jgi:hypothetical protein
LLYSLLLFFILFDQRCPTVCVTCVWAGVDSVWEQEKPEARKMLENAAESHTSGARFVGRLLGFSLDCLLAFFRYKEFCAAPRSFGIQNEQVPTPN